jgi:hypothetical protein
MQWRNNMHCIKLILPLLFASLTFARPQTIDCTQEVLAKTIDGDISDWKSNFVRLQSNEGCVVSCTNTDSTLSFCLISTDRNLSRQIIMDGFNLSFRGRQKSRSALFEITFPTGIHSSGSAIKPSRDNGRDPQAMKEFEDQMLQSLVITGPDSKSVYPMSHSVADSFGVKVTCLHLKDSLIYEINIPLKKGTPVTDSISLVSNSEIHMNISTVESILPPGNNPGVRDGSPPPDQMGGNSFSTQRPPHGRGPGMPPKDEQFSADLLIKLKSK